MAFNLPPGCRVSDIPGNGPAQPCEICGGDPDKDKPPGHCLCPECPECGDYGNPECYERHGLKRSLEQEAQRAEMEKLWAQDAEATAVFEADFIEYDENDNAVPKKPDATPPEIKAAVAEAERCLHVLERAYAAGIKPEFTVKRLVELAAEIQAHHDKWKPPTNVV